MDIAEKFFKPSSEWDPETLKRYSDVSLFCNKNQEYIMKEFDDYFQCTKNEISLEELKNEKFIENDLKFNSKRYSEILELELERNWTKILN